MTVHCKACHHQWDVIMPLPIPIERAVLVMKGAVAAGCPQCHAYGANVLCGPAVPVARTPRAPTSSHDQDRDR